MNRSNIVLAAAIPLIVASISPLQAQYLQAGQQCRPAVAQPQMYRDCQVVAVDGAVMCQCIVEPGAPNMVVPGALTGINRFAPQPPTEEDPIGPPGRPTATRGNPGNAKPVGNAGETPNGGSQASWGNDSSGLPGTAGRSDSGSDGPSSTGSTGAGAGTGGSSGSGGGNGGGNGNGGDNGKDG